MPSLQKTLLVFDWGDGNSWFESLPVKLGFDVKNSEEPAGTSFNTLCRGLPTCDCPAKI